MKRYLALLAACLSACSSGPDAEQQRLQQRVTELEGQKAQLESDLKQARDNVTALQRVIERGTSGSDDSGSTSEGTPGAAVDPQPDNNIAAPGI